MARLFPMANAEQKQRSFTANATWTAPLTTSSIATATGKGASGSPAGTTTRWREKKTFTVDYDPGFGTDNSTDTFSFKSLSQSDGVDYCDPPVRDNAAHATTQYCYDYTLSTTSTPATTGASATFAAGVSGTSRTFPGGVGGAASVTTFSDVPVVPGQTYNIVVPAGGSITITYLE